MFKSINISERLYEKNVITYVRKMRMGWEGAVEEDTEAQRNYRNSKSSPVWILYSGSRIPVPEYVHLIIS